MDYGLLNRLIKKEGAKNRPPNKKKKEGALKKKKTAGAFGGGFFAPSFLISLFMIPYGNYLNLKIIRIKNMKYWYGYPTQARARSGTCFHFLMKNVYFWLER